MVFNGKISSENMKSQNACNTATIPPLIDYIPKYEKTEDWQKKQQKKVLYKIILAIIALLIGVIFNLPTNNNLTIEKYSEIRKDIARQDISNEFEDLIIHLQRLDEVIDRKIEKAIGKYDADKTGIIDFAMESAGGSVISTPDTQSYPVQSVLWYSFPKISVLSDPQSILQPENKPGQCFAFVGNAGRIRIKLSRRIFVTAVSVEHAPLTLLLNIQSAPREFAVYGLKDADAPATNQLGLFEYKLQNGPVQTFHLNNKNTHKELAYEYVELRIFSNYGDEEYTCLYRFRVHGNPL